jgi:hypothetical protein
MIAAIAQKEFTEIVRDGRFKWTSFARLQPASTDPPLT